MYSNNTESKTKHAQLKFVPFLGNSPASENSDAGELPKKEQIAFRTRRKLKNKNDTQLNLKSQIISSLRNILYLL